MVALFILTLPGISVGQCPTSFSGKMGNDLSTTTCGLRSIDVILLTSNDFTAYLGTVYVQFSSNARIESVVPTSGIGSITVNGLSDTDFYLSLSNVTINSNGNQGPVLATVYYTLMTGTSGTAETTSNYMAAVNGGGFTNCGPGGNEPAYTLSMQRRTLTGNILIPSQFGCSQGSNHGLADRDVSVSMNYSPYWEICDIIDTPNDGEYECMELRGNCEYKVCISKPDDEICGIGENDIDMISDYILGADSPDYIWQYLAADVNNNGSITSQDIIQLAKILISEPYIDIPLPWKYISTSELNDPGLETLFDECEMEGISIIDNCDEITMSGHPVVEDWYGFPVGDVDYSCTDCAFKSDPVVRTNQDLFRPVLIRYSTEADRSIHFQFSASEPVRVWSLSLHLDPDIIGISELLYEKNKEDIFLWNYEKSSNLLKMVYVSITLQSPPEFKFHIKYVGTIAQKFPSVKINLEDPKINNILIDINKNQRKFELESNYSPVKQFAFYLPDLKAIRVINSSNNFDRISIFDLTGKCILSCKNVDQFISVDHIPNGVYIVQRISNQDGGTLKLLIH